MTQSLIPGVAAVVALVPAAFALWWGRGLARLADDPALSERLLASRSRSAFVTCFSIACLAVVARSHLVWALPLLVVARMARFVCIAWSSDS